MNLAITQENVHLLLPSKLSWMANMLAEDRGISIVEAMKLLYASDVYSSEFFKLLYPKVVNI